MCDRHRLNLMCSCIGIFYEAGLTLCESTAKSKYLLLKWRVADKRVDKNVALHLPEEHLECSPSPRGRSQFPALEKSFVSSLVQIVLVRCLWMARCVDTNLVTSAVAQQPQNFSVDFCRMSARGKSVGKFIIDCIR